MKFNIIEFSTQCFAPTQRSSNTNTTLVDKLLTNNQNNIKAKAKVSERSEMRGDESFDTWKVKLNLCNFDLGSTFVMAN